MKKDDDAGFKDFKIDPELDSKSKDLEKGVIQGNINFKKTQNQNLEKKLKDLKIPDPINTDSTNVMGKGDSDVTTGTVKPLKVDKVVKDLPLSVKSSIKEQIDTQGGEIIRGDDEFSDEELEKRRTYDDFSDEEKSEIDAEWVDMTPFTKKEVVILKTLHKNLTKEELYKISEETPQAYGTTDNKFWSVMKLFGIEETYTEQNTRESRYAKWAYDNWTEDGDYGSIEEPIKTPLKWYHVDRDESGSQVEYKSGEAEVLGFDEDDAGERADYDFYAWGG